MSVLEGVYIGEWCGEVLSMDEEGGLAGQFVNYGEARTHTKVEHHSIAYISCHSYRYQQKVRPLIDLHVQQRHRPLIPKRDHPSNLGHDQGQYWEINKLLIPLQGLPLQTHHRHGHLPATPIIRHLLKRRLHNPRVELQIFRVQTVENVLFQNQNLGILKW